MTKVERDAVAGPDDRPNPDLEAAEWLVRLGEAGLVEKSSVERDLEQWRRADPRNEAAYQRVARTWAAIGAHEAAPEIVALRNEAREELDRRRNSRSRGKRLRWSLFAVADVAAIAAAVVAYLLFWPASVEIVTTGIGQTKTVQLRDGSRMELDAMSSASVAFDRNVRLVHVLKGQAYFQVAKHQPRPFVVEDHGRSVVATGTAFDVETLADGMHVTLVEGHVVVKSGDGPSGPEIAKLEPGDSLTATSGPPQLVHRANLLALLAWRTGHLMFDNVTLGEAAARMSRYVHQRVEIDPAIADLRISGVFSAGDMRGMINAIEAFYPVKDVPAGPGTVRLLRRS